MKYYREIDLDNFEIIQEKLKVYAQEILQNKTYRIIGFHNINDNKRLLSTIPELQSAFDKYNLVIHKIAFYVADSPTIDYVPADQPLKNRMHTVRNPIHTDLCRHEARINLPILNTKGTYTRFFTNCVVKPWINPITRSPFQVVANTDYIEVDAIEIIKPTVLRVQEPHMVQIYEGSLLPRITLTIEFYTDPVYLLE